MITKKVESRTANSTLSIGGVPYPFESFVLAESSVLRTNICAEIPRLCKAANR